MRKDEKLKVADSEDRLGEQQQAEEPEFHGEIDWEWIEKQLSEDPELAEQVKKDLSDNPELSQKYQELIRQKAAEQRMLRFASEGDWERFKSELDARPLKEKRAFNRRLDSAVMRELHLVAWQEVLDSTGRDKEGKEALCTALLYTQLNPQDGVESTLAPLIVTLKATIMESVRRASRSDALPVRNIELDYAMKGAVVLAALIKAFDKHREQTR